MSYSKLYLILFGLVVFYSTNTQAQRKATVITNDFLTKDGRFSSPYVDIDEWRNTPVPHRYIHGGFKGTETRFSYYFPTKETYQGRFFQYITPVPDSENLSQNSGGGEADKISFAISQGAYFVETNGGGADAAVMSPDVTIGAYKANAAAALYSKEKAAEFYGKHRTYGYAFGGSGGAYRTLGCAENTIGIWDGTVPFVLGSPMAIPNVFSIRMHGMRVLKNKLPQIVDALEPGGSENIYAGLNDEELAALKEVTAMGFPNKAWFNYKNMGIHAFPAIYGGMKQADSEYFKDFWTKLGYLGADHPESFKGDRIQQKVIIKKAITETMLRKMGVGITDNPGTARGSADRAWEYSGDKGDTIPMAFQLTSLLPEMQFLGGDLNVLSGKEKGKNIILKAIDKDLIILGAADVKILNNIKAGDTVEIDNSDFLASQTYHRHQVPGPEYYVWNQFRNEEGKPIYPQRPMIIGPLFAKFTIGSLPTGKFNGKMIVLESLWDTEAFPWQADWYKTHVKEQLGDAIDENFRLYFTDHANHADYPFPGDPTHFVSYIGVLQQALLDLSAWVEKGIVPPANTTYKVDNGQVIVPNNAEDRMGMQPTIDLSANGKQRADVKRNKEVSFNATIEVPKNTGKIVSVEWDFEGKGLFADRVLITEPKNALLLKTTHKYKKPGTYFVTLRVASQRQGDMKTPYARINNLARVRVVVE